MFQDELGGGRNTGRVHRGWSGPSRSLKTTKVKNIMMAREGGGRGDLSFWIHILYTTINDILNKLTTILLE